MFDCILILTSKLFDVHHSGNKALDPLHLVYMDKHLELVGATDGPREDVIYNARSARSRALSVIVAKRIHQATNMRRPLDQSWNLTHATHGIIVLRHNSMHRLTFEATCSWRGPGKIGTVLSTSLRVTQFFLMSVSRIQLPRTRRDISDQRFVTKQLCSSALLKESRCTNLK